MLIIISSKGADWHIWYVKFIDSYIDGPFQLAFVAERGKSYSSIMEISQVSIKFNDSICNIFENSLFQWSTNNSMNDMSHPISESCDTGYHIAN